MKRLALLALLGLTACIEDPPGDEVDAGVVLPDCAEGAGAVGTSQQAMRRAGTGPEDDGRERVLVRFKAGQAPDPRLIEASGGVVKARLERLGVVAARLTPAQRDALARDPSVAAIEEDRKVHAFGFNVPSPSYFLQAPVAAGSVGEETFGLKLVQAPDVWDSNADGILDPGARTGEGVKVCIIDSGMDITHPELRAAYLKGQDFVEGEGPATDDDPRDCNACDGPRPVIGSGHGTHVAGTIAAQFGSAGVVDPLDRSLDPNGVVGVAPGVQLLVARVLDVNGSGFTSDVNRALEWCEREGAKIATLSLGSAKENDSERDAVKKAQAAGMLLVAATGNDGKETLLAYPAAYPGVVAVGAVNPDGGVSDFSQRFPVSADTNVDGGVPLGPKEGSLVAPGSNIYSTRIVGHGTLYLQSLSVGGVSYGGKGLDYSPTGTYSGPLVNCGFGGETALCSGGTCGGFVAYVDRGGEVTFADKVKYAKQQGAKAVIIGNNDPADDERLAFTLGDPGDWVPTVAVSTADATELKRRIDSTVSLDLRGTDYATQDGTSMATPHVTAVAALVWGAYPDLTASELRRVLQSNARDLGPTGYDQNYGYGLVQAKAALDELDAAAAAANVAPSPLR